MQRRREGGSRGRSEVTAGQGQEPRVQVALEVQKQRTVSPESPEEVQVCGPRDFSLSWTSDLQNGPGWFQH